MEPGIRRYQDGDHDAVYDICARTADAGGDARGQYGTDDLPGDPAEAGAIGVHVCVVNANTRALGFYPRVGFDLVEVDDPGGVTYLGRPVR